MVTGGLPSFTKHSWVGPPTKSLPLTSYLCQRLGWWLEQWQVDQIWSQKICELISLLSLCLHFVLATHGLDSDQMNQAHISWLEILHSYLWHRSSIQIFIITGLKKLMSICWDIVVLKILTSEGSVGSDLCHRVWQVVVPYCLCAGVGALDFGFEQTQTWL